MIVFPAHCDPDLNREEVAPSMALPPGAGKKTKEEAGATDRRIPLAPVPPNESTAEACPAGAGKKMEQATAEARPAGPGKEMKESTAKKKMEEAVDVASESGYDGALNKEKEKEKEKEKQEGDSLFKEGEMLKLWEELREAEGLWSQKHVPGALDSWLERKRKTTQAPAIAGLKKKKVVRVALPDDYIDYVKGNPGMMRELSDEEMARCPDRFRQRHAITKLINAKNRAYQQALIDQHRAFGFAYDEKEVTDDDEEAAVVKN